jgi:DNA-directed RNA polymerase specialized sigma24 family protein
MQTATAENIRESFEAKVRRGIFRPVARHLPESVREDRLHDAVCQTFEMYDRYARRGTILADAILVHSCRQRAVDPSRNFVKADRTQPKRDAYDPRNYLAGHVELHHLDGCPIEGADDVQGEGDRSLHLALFVEFSRDPTEAILSAIDATSWLDGLNEADRELALRRVAGFTLGEVADDMCRSVSSVFSRTRELGVELAERAGIDLKRRRKARRPRRAVAVETA